MKRRHAMVRCANKRWTRVCFLLLLVMAMGTIAAPTTPAPRQWRMQGVGSGDFGWVLTKVTVGIPGPDGQAIERGQIYQLPASAPVGTVLAMRAHALNEPPIFMSAYSDRLVLIYRPTTEAKAPTNAAESTTNATTTSSAGGKTSSANDPSSGRRLFPVRSVRVALVNEFAVFYDPPDRYVIEDPLSASGEIVSVADSAMGFAVVLQGADGASIQLLNRDGWRSLSTPGDLAASAPISIFADGDGLALVSRLAAGHGTLWRLDRLDGEWRSSSVSEKTLNGTVAATSAGLVSHQYDALAKTLTFHLVTGEQAIELATIPNIPTSHAVARVGENYAVVWMDEDSPARMRVVVVSSVTGRTLYDDYAILAPALSPGDLRMVALLLSTVTLGVLLFLLKPEDALRAEPPGGWAHTTPGRRLAAGAVDLFLAGLVSALIWDESIVDVIDPSYLLLMNGADSWPVLTVMGVYFAHGLAGEGFFGLTVGKAIVRCRVRSTRHSKVRLWQAAVRNLVKVIAPPLVALVLIDPNRRHPGDLLAGTIVISPEAPDDDEPEDESSDGGAPDGADSADSRSSSDNSIEDQSD